MKEPIWPDNVFSSSEIEEITYRGSQQVKNVKDQVQVHLFFEPHKAKGFVDAVRMSRLNPVIVEDLLQFVRYIAYVVDLKLEEANDGPG